jgi:hypothetical protein
MSKIPFEKQRLQVDLVAQIEHEIALGNGMSGSDLLGAIEQSVNLQLAAPLRDIVSKFSIPAVKRRGRPSNHKGREDFALEEVDDLYPPLLRKHEGEAEKRRLLAAAAGDVLATAESTPSELAYTEILNLNRMKRFFPNLDWQTLRNKHSQWKNGHFHSADNHVDSEDFDAEIERQFPAPERRS